MGKDLFIKGFDKQLIGCKKNQESFDIDLSNFKPKVVEPKTKNKEKSKDNKDEIVVILKEWLKNLVFLINWGP